MEEEAKGYPVYIRTNVSFQELHLLYANSKIFWHATGLNEDENIHPERLEHFGMTTVEAMASGCVPLVINKGGQPEIVSHGGSGYLWDTVEELAAYTKELICDEGRLARLSGAAVCRSRDFSRDVFFDKLRSMLANS